MRVDPERTPLAQHYGFSPGTYIIQSFGSTEQRSTRTAQVDPANPSPAHYNPKLQTRGVVHHSDTSWGSEAAVGEVVLRTARHEHVHAARSRTFRLALEPSVRDKKKGTQTSNLKIHADSPIRWKRLDVT